jgi:hypothetical protein
MKTKLNIIVVLPLLMIPAQSFANTGEASFTPTGFQIPIMKLTLSKNTGSVGSAFSASNEQVLYKCSSTTEANCLVDIASQQALNNITSQLSTLTAGTYDQIGLYTCADGKGGSSSVSVNVKGSFTSGGTTYYTDPATANGNGVSSALSAADFTTIANFGCSTRSILLATPITVTSTSTINATLLVENSFLAYSTSNTSSGLGGCKVSSGRGVCVNGPIIIPYVSTSALGTVTTKRYKVSWNNASTGGVVDNKANAIVVIPVAGTTPLMGYTVSYYTDTSATSVTDTTFGGASVGNATDPSTFKVNADGSVAFSVGGSLDTNQVIFSAFKLADHTGTATTRGGATWYYHATPY